jgi:AraC-like DNA-binding protein
MLKTILLLSPVYVTLFWCIVLNTQGDNYSVPKSFLGKFMFFCFIVYFSHFLYFSNLENAYCCIDPIYQFASLLVYPLYYIYFRLLTVDSKFSFKKHFVYLLPSTILFILYSIAVFFTPQEEYKAFLFGEIQHTLNHLSYLEIISFLIRIVFLIQVILTVIGNFRLIKKYGHKAAQYYSDIEDSSISKVKLLNYTLIITALSSFILGMLGREFFASEITYLAIASVVFSSMLFIIGWLGNKQKSLNPVYETDNVTETQQKLEELSLNRQNELINKIDYLFNDRKIYLNSSLTILDVARLTGTNRTYVSSLINHHFHQNFSAFVNNYRLKELEEKILFNPEYSNSVLAETCGFGSVDSMKRAIAIRHKLTLQEFKSQVLLKKVV